MARSIEGWISKLAEQRRTKASACSLCGGPSGLGTILVVFEDDPPVARCEECESWLTPNKKKPVDKVYWLRDRKRPV